MSNAINIALAPMEGLVDPVLRALLTGQGGIDWCVTEFVRISGRLLPDSSFYRLMPELVAGARTPAGVPVHLQLLGSCPQQLAENAARAVALGAPVIDLNFGCPARTVNRSQGGAILLKAPDRLERIVSAVRQAVPSAIPVSAKMRLGYDSPDEALDCARALVAGGAAFLVVHARTRREGYRPPVHWEWVARIQSVVNVPVYANGDIWSLEDWQRCRQISGARHVMLGRGLVSRPDLARQIAAAAAGQPVIAMGWRQLQPLLLAFWQQTLSRIGPVYAPGRLKQWLGMLARNYPQAQQLFGQVRCETSSQLVQQHLLAAMALQSVDGEHHESHGAAVSPVGRF